MPGPIFEVDSNLNENQSFLVVVTIALFTAVTEELQILLTRRDTPPFRDSWALPTGFVEFDEDLDSAALRKLSEVSGIENPRHLEQFSTCGDPDRDPRTRVISINYWGATPEAILPKRSPESIHATFVPLSELKTQEFRLAFDHSQIITNGLFTAQKRIGDSTIATQFCQSEFTISQLRHVYDTVWDTQIEPANFQRKVKQSKGFLVQLDRKAISADMAGRPAELWTAGPALELIPPLSKPNELSAPLTNLDPTEDTSDPPVID